MQKRAPSIQRSLTRRDESGGGLLEDRMRRLLEPEVHLSQPDAKTGPGSGVAFSSMDREGPAIAVEGGVVNNRDRAPVQQDWDHRERLRQQFLTVGHQSMPDDEVLELLLFNAIARIDVKPLAKRLLETFGDLSGVIAAPEYRLLKVDGATPRVWLQLRIAEAFAQRMARGKVLGRNVISGWSELIAYCRTMMGHRTTEQVRLLFLDRKNKLIADEEQSAGTVDHVPVYPREIAKRALELNASAIILVHNHPSGDPTPSGPDIDMTLRVVSACEAVGVEVHDHIVIGYETEISFRTMGLI